MTETVKNEIEFVIEENELKELVFNHIKSNGLFRSITTGIATADDVVIHASTDDEGNILEVYAELKINRA